MPHGKNITIFFSAPYHFENIILCRIAVCEILTLFPDGGGTWYLAGIFAVNLLSAAIYIIIWIGLKSHDGTEKSESDLIIAYDFKLENEIIFRLSDNEANNALAIHRCCSRLVRMVSHART